jgi:hypothetical protein
MTGSNIHASTRINRLDGRFPRKGVRDWIKIAAANLEGIILLVGQLERLMERRGILLVYPVIKQP